MKRTLYQKLISTTKSDAYKLLVILIKDLFEVHWHCWQYYYTARNTLSKVLLKVRLHPNLKIDIPLNKSSIFKAL